MAGSSFPTASCATYANTISQMQGKCQGVNLTNEILQEILNLLRQKVEPENAQKFHEAPHRSVDAPSEVDASTQESVITETKTVETTDDNENSPPEADATTIQEYIITETSNVGTDNVENWPNDETIERYRDRCARHKSECKKMQVELGCFIAHLGLVGGDKRVIEYVEGLRKVLLSPVQCLERALDEIPGGRGTAMGNIRSSIFSLWDEFGDFDRLPNHDGALYHNKFKRWKNIAINGYCKIRDPVDEGQYVKCLEFIHDVFFTDLETVMSGVVEALTAFEEKSASEWLAAQKIGDFETRYKSYLSRLFPPMDEIKGPGTWPKLDEIQKFGKRIIKHQRLNNQMQVELDHLVSHYIIIGGDIAVVEASTSLKQAMFAFVQYLESAVRERPEDFQTQMCDIVQQLLLAVIHFQSSLYHQKHAFYFREIKQWVTCTRIGVLRTLSLLNRGEVSECIEYINDTFLSEFERAMIGIAHGEQETLGDGVLSAVPEELKMFRKESLPKFLVDQMERDTTRYINLTTIATFFSSVTATALQFTYAPLQTEASVSLRGVVNLLWFLSLIFSVSSAVSSLLGLTWRKSSIYDLRRPPWLIHMWFDKAPMLFLIISAVAFVIGLNLFAYLSLQPRFVLLATSILTGLHAMCLLVVTFWFIYQLKHGSIWAGWMRIVIKPITAIAYWFIMKAMECIRKCMKLIKKMAKRPYNRFKQNLHLQRNFFWAFGVDNRVARLNYNIKWDRDWPGPYLLSKLIRCVAYPIKKCWLATKRVISELGHTVRKQTCCTSRVGYREGDIELGERGTRDNTEASEETSPESPVEKAKNEYRGSLQKIFSEPRWVDSIMDDVEKWEKRNWRKRYAERIGRKLWGYPDLVKEFHDRVRPVLVEARNEKNGRRRQEMSTEHRGGINSVPAPTIVGQEEDYTASILPQSSQIVPLDNGSGPSDARQTSEQQDSPDQQDDRPLPPDEPSRHTVAASAEALESTSGDQDLPLDAPKIGEGSNLSYEIVEVTSTEYEDERSRAAQCKGKALE